MSFGTATQNSVAVGIAGIPTLVCGSGSASPPVIPPYLLKEDGFGLLTESGFYILLE